jgi:hypothetical protein
VLITTQSQHWPPGQALDVPVLDIEVAADFLVNRTGDQDRPAARELATALDGLPLALEQAAAYMQATGTHLARYLPLFRTRQADLLARGEAAGHPADVTATLTLALSRLAAQAPAAAGLLRLLAFLASEPVPLALLFTNEQIADPSGLGLPTELAPLLGDALAVGVREQGRRGCHPRPRVRGCPPGDRAGTRFLSTDCAWGHPDAPATAVLHGK